MLCDRCGKNEANVHIESTVDGIKKEENLCAQCARGDVLETFNIGNLFSGIVQSEEILHCDNCGMTIKEFEQIGKFGCPECYKHLRAEIKPVLKRIHGSTKYNGYEQTQEDKKRMTIQEFKSKLSEAIAMEDYEKAAEYRDRIRLLEEGEPNDSLD